MIRRILVILLLPILLTGCGSLSTTLKNTPPQAQNAKITLEFWTLQLLKFKDVLQPMIHRYETEHPGISIHWVDLPFSEGEKRVLTAIMSPEVPDVVNLNPDFSAILANRKTLLDMNRFVSQTARDRYLPVAWQSVSLGKIADDESLPSMMKVPPRRGIGGDTVAIAFGLPWYLTSKVTLYNEMLIRKAGWRHPPKTFDELAAFSRDLQAHAGGATYAMMPDLAESGNFLKELQQIGVPLYQDNRAIFATPKAIHRLKFWANLFKKGLIPAETITESHQAAIDRYQSGSLALLLSGPNFLNIVRENAPEIFNTTGVVPQFPTDSPFIHFATMLLAIPARSQHPKEAVDFALFMTNAENQLAFSHTAPVLPSVTAALQNPYFQETQSASLIDRARSLSAQQLLTAKSAYQIHPSQKEINEIIDYYVQLALLGKTDPETALKHAQQDINIRLEAEAR